ncbi:hypothetical protein ES319_D05G075700v1 [Gossypium barbadense]|uniref:Uncharacterized protein n=1 Tax=Gossypium barbadense TaxID=3634 RepID=A0A5J5R9G9_GOSBA|nr:hypothetical protein ES319_D05G075700v1 [Gossypium barbadense]
MPSHAFLFFTAVRTHPAGHRCRVCHFPMTNEAQCLVSAVGFDWCILVVPLLRRGTGLLLSTFPPSFDNGDINNGSNGKWVPKQTTNPSL